MSFSRSLGIYLSYRLVYKMDECRTCGKAEFNAIFSHVKMETEIVLLEGTNSKLINKDVG